MEKVSKGSAKEIKTKQRHSQMVRLGCGEGCVCMCVCMGIHLKGGRHLRDEARETSRSKIAM